MNILSRIFSKSGKSESLNQMNSYESIQSDFSFQASSPFLELDYSTHNPNPISPMIEYDQLTSALAPIIANPYDGDKFAGGFGATQLFKMDYWTLRRRSAQLFTENLYARGMIRRLVTNEINTGLNPEATPDEKTLGFAEDFLRDWTEDVETAFDLWARTPTLCDFKGKNSFWALQAIARIEALVSGDCLVVCRQNAISKLPQIQLISGNLVGSPLSEQKIRSGNTVEEGVELDSQGREVAYWVRQEDLSYKRIAAYGERSGRFQAKLVYGTDRRIGDVRGEPILALVLQSLKEIDRYRDSVQRKAVINSLVALFIKKTNDKPGSLPMTAGAVKKNQYTTESATASAPARKFNMSSYMPGLIMEELQVGEEPVMKGGEGTDLNFGAFEESIIAAIAWANEIPPEILRLAFSNNYSASQAAINEFKIYLNRFWAIWGEQFCQPIYTEYMLSATLAGKIKADTLLASWRDGSKQDKFAAWTSAEWYGSIKPSTDMLKQVKGSDLLVAGGYSTRAREARITTGTKFSKNTKRLKRENELLAEALEPILELRQKYSSLKDSLMPNALAEQTDSSLDEEISALIEELESNASRNTA